MDLGRRVATKLGPWTESLKTVKERGLMAELQNGFNWVIWIDPLLDAKCVNRRTGLGGVAAKPGPLVLIITSWYSLGGAMARKRLYIFR
jgi:hypothetical protein